jgi:Zn finger protein HypA/HybF involved in hydrogenase expression
VSADDTRPDLPVPLDEYAAIRGAAEATAAPLDRETLGRLVHGVRLAHNAERERPFGLLPWEERDARQQELDMRIGEAVARAGRERAEQAEAERAGFREQARILGEEKAEWLCEACEVIHPWRDGDRFTATCPVCGSPMMPTSMSLRSRQVLARRADAAEAALAEIRSLCGEGAPAVAVDRIEAILGTQERTDEEEAAERDQLRAALKRHTHHFTDHAGVDLCGGCLRPSPCPDAALCGEEP